MGREGEGGEGGQGDGVTGMQNYGISKETSDK